MAARRKRGPAGEAPAFEDEMARVTVILTHKSWRQTYVGNCGHGLCLCGYWHVPGLHARFKDCSGLAAVDVRDLMATVSRTAHATKAVQ